MVISGRDMEACHRLSPKFNAVVCKLVNREDAEEAVRNSSRLKDINKEELGLSPNSSLFINEHLTPFNSKLAFYCRRLKKKSLIKWTKSQKGVVKVLIEVKTDNEESTLKWKKISHKSELEKLFPNLDELIR